MQGIRNPRWLHAVTVLPLTALLALGYHRYDIIGSLLEPAGRLLWMTNAQVLVALIVAVFTVAVVLDALHRRLGWLTLTALFAAVTAYLVWTGYQLNDLLPVGVPAWLRGDGLLLPLLTFTMPSLLWAVLACVQLSTVNYSGKRPERNFLNALAVPLVVYACGQLVVPLLTLESAWATATLLIVPLILSTALFLFLLLRGSYLIVRRKAGIKVRTWGVPILTLLLPLVGLAVNQRLGDESRWLHHNGLFGDFNRPLVYAMVLVNGLYCSLPRGRGASLYRLLLFTAGSAGLSFLLYFVLLFLPFLPLSLVAVLLMGLGLLLLVPVLIFPLQLHLLWQDYLGLRSVLDGRVLTVGAALAFSLIPAGITVDYLGDRATLDRALAYVYHPADVSGPIDHASLQRVVNHVRKHKSASNTLLGSSPGTQPYLSSYYGWLVLDNLTLSEEKLGKLEAVFLGIDAESSETTTVVEASDPVAIIYAQGASTWDSEAGAWRSWVHLELVADSALVGQGEYRTSFELPDGAYIDNYYLYVGDRREPGILAERRTATWVYTQITGARQDPGLLRFVSANRLRLNVFPFTGGEIRRTGFSILHREALTLRIDDRILPLGRKNDHVVEEAIQLDGVTYLSPNVKRSLSTVHLQPRIHYVLDASRRNLEQENTWAETMCSPAEHLTPASKAPPALTLAGTYPQSFDLEGDWQTALAATSPGGFFPERAVEHILNRWMARPDSTYPVIVFLGDPVIDHDFSAYAHALPGGLHLYRMGADGQPYALGEDGQAVTLPETVTAYRYTEPDGREVYLSVNDEPSLVVGTGPQSTSGIWRTSTAWRRATVLRGRYLANRLGGRTGQAPWLEEVRGSFATGVLMPTTAMIVVENKAQQRALQKRQREVLDADPHFDLEETIEMSEPPGWLYLIVLPLLLYLAPALRRR